MSESTTEVLGMSRIIILSAVAVVTLVAYCHFFQVGSKKAASTPNPAAVNPTVKQVMTLEELAAFDGSSKDLPILLGINGKVYDVTKGKDYYGKEGGYHVMAGKDASRLLAKNLLDPKKDNGQPLTEDENRQLKQWQDFFENKYSVVAVVAPKAA